MLKRLQQCTRKRGTAVLVSKLNRTQNHPDAGTLAQTQQTTTCSGARFHGFGQLWRKLNKTPACLTSHRPLQA
jgi:hypothetical protein